MKKLNEYKVSMPDETAESCTAYQISRVFGFRFVVTRDDSGSRKTWSVSQHETGLRAGPLCDTRADAIGAFSTRIEQLLKQHGEYKVVERIRNAIANGPVLNQ